jgi:hypothetical protein
MPVLLGERRISVGEMGWKKRIDAMLCVYGCEMPVIGRRKALRLYAGGNIPKTKKARIKSRLLKYLKKKLALLYAFG